VTIRASILVLAAAGCVIAAGARFTRERADPRWAAPAQVSRENTAQVRAPEPRVGLRDGPQAVLQGPAVLSPVSSEPDSSAEPPVPESVTGSVARKAQPRSRRAPRATAARHSPRPHVSVAKLRPVHGMPTAQVHGISTAQLEPIQMRLADRAGDAH
jgi:hypothetical protein